MICCCISCGKNKISNCYASEFKSFTLIKQPLMIQHTLKSLKTIKSPTASFIVRIIRGKLPENKNKVHFLKIKIMYFIFIFRQFPPDDPNGETGCIWGFYSF